MTWFVRFILILMILVSVLGTACKTEEDEANERAYKANYEKAYQTALKEGEKKGEEEGNKIGIAEAEKAALAGTAWQLYYYPALGIILLGVSVGLIIQYGILWRCRRTGILPQFSAVVFVPAMNSTISYSIFLRRQEVMIEIDEKLRELAARKKLQNTRIEELKEGMRRKIEAISSIEDLTQARIIELANEELEKIVELAEEKQKIQSEIDSEDDILEL